MTEPIRFEDGAAYERYMGVWSRLAGETFLDWLRPAAGSRWLDVGCGNGAFTELIADRCAPASIDGVDPSDAQLAFARTRPVAEVARFRQGDAMALPFPEAAFDVAVMPLVIFFVPDPAKGVAEMARVVRPGGIVAAYGWDLDDGGFPYEALLAEIRALGFAVPLPPSPDASRLDVLRELWTRAGFKGIDTRTITVRRTFDSFETYWTTVLGAASVGRTLAAMPAETVADLRSRLRAKLRADAAGRITCEGRANAVKGGVFRAGS